MGMLASRLARLERRVAGSEGGQAVCGNMLISHETGTGPDMVEVQHTGERLTEAQFRQGYPRGLLLTFTDYGDPDDLVG
jgi:hypothetical protein